MRLFLSSKDIASLLGTADYLETIENAYREMGRGQTTMLPRINVGTPKMSGFLKILPGSLSGERAAGIHAYSISGLAPFTKVILLFDIDTGDLQAVIESDRIGWLVPGAASGVATKYLAKKEARVMGIFGSGRQARSQLLSISSVKNLELVKVYSPQKTHREQFCEEMKKRLGLRVIPVDSSEEAVKGSEIISTTTLSTTPIFDGHWVEPGTHINAIGAHYPDRREVDTVCVQRSKVVVDSKERALNEEGELLIPIGEGTLNAEHIYGELGEIAAGVKKGRASNEEITLFLSGATAIEYVAVGARAYQKAREKGVGQELRMEEDPTLPKSLYMKPRKKVTGK